MTEEKKILTHSGIAPVDRIRSKAWTREAHHIYIDMRNLMGSLAEASEWEMAAIVAEVLQVWKEQMRIATSLLPKIQHLRDEDQLRNSKAGKYHHIASELVTEILDMERHLREDLKDSGLSTRLFKALTVAQLGLGIENGDVTPTDRPRGCSCYPWYGHHFKTCPVVQEEVAAAQAEKEKEGDTSGETGHRHWLSESTNLVPMTAEELRVGGIRDQNTPPINEIHVDLGHEWEVYCVINGREYEFKNAGGKSFGYLRSIALSMAGMDTADPDGWQIHNEEGVVLDPDDYVETRGAKFYISRPPGVGA